MNTFSVRDLVIVDGELGEVVCGWSNAAVIRLGNGRLVLATTGQIIGRDRTVPATIIEYETPRPEVSFLPRDLKSDSSNYSERVEDDSSVDQIPVKWKRAVVEFFTQEVGQLIPDIANEFPDELSRVLATSLLRRMLARLNSIAIAQTGGDVSNGPANYDLVDLGCNI